MQLCTWFGSRFKQTNYKKTLGIIRKICIWIGYVYSHTTLNVPGLESGLGIRKYLRIYC